MLSGIVTAFINNINMPDVCLNLSCEQKPCLGVICIYLSSCVHTSVGIMEVSHEFSNFLFQSSGQFIINIVTDIFWQPFCLFLIVIKFPCKH